MRELTTVCFNGEIVEARRVPLEPFSRALRWGDGLFETIRVRAGVPEFLADHIGRIRSSAAALGFPVPRFEDLYDMAYRFLRASSLEQGALRMMLTRSDAGRLWPCGDPDPEPVVLLSGSEGVPYPPELIARGLVAAVVDQPRRFAGFLSRHKTTSYVSSVLARRAAFQRSADIGLMLNQFGRIAEADVANVFVRYEDGRIATPPLEEGALPGITRLRLMRALGTVEEVPVTYADLTMASEVLFTNALMPVMPAARLDDRIFTQRDFFAIAWSKLEGDPHAHKGIF